MEKININRYIAYSMGLILVALGTILGIKSDLGVSVATAPAYVLNAQYSAISFGTFNYIVQGFVLILFFALMKSIKLRYFLTFVTSVIFGFVLDFTDILLQAVTVDLWYLKLFYFVISIVLIAGGLVFFIRSGLPIMPFDIFVSEISQKYNIQLGRFKMSFDLTTLALAVVLSFAYFGLLNGIYIGTVISAFAIGPVMDLLAPFFNRYLSINAQLA